MAESQILAQNSCNADTGLFEVGNSVSALNNKNEANCISCFFMRFYEIFLITLKQRTPL